MHHAHSHFSSLHGSDSLHFELPHRTRGFGFGDIVDGVTEVAKDVAGVGKGIVEGAVDTVTGIADAVTNPVETATGIAKLVTDPTEAWPAVWHGIVDPIVEDWQNGNPGEAIGRGGWAIFETVFGAKGLTKVGKAGKVIKAAPDVPDAPRPIPKPDAPKPDAPKPDVDAPKPDGPDGTGPVVDARTGAALNRLEDAGVKFSKGDVVWADELPAESVIQAKAGVAFLETGNARAGLQHILHGNPDVPGSKGHAADFARRGVPEDQVDDLLREAVTKGTVVDGPKKGSYDVTVDFNGTQQKLRLAIGTNGFIVSAYPI